MAGWSIALGVLSLACVGLGVVLTPIPVVGALFAFAAPALAIAGIITGGIAMARAKRAAVVAPVAAPPPAAAPSLAEPAVLPSEAAASPLEAPAPHPLTPVPRPTATAVTPPSSGAALTGVIISSVALLPALLTALTCGVCNALCATGQMQTHRNLQFDIQRSLPPPLEVPDAGSPRTDAGSRPQSDAPPPAFPAPPLDPGPSDTPQQP